MIEPKPKKFFTYKELSMVNNTKNLRHFFNQLDTHLEFNGFIEAVIITKNNLKDEIQNLGKYLISEKGLYNFDFNEGDINTSSLNLKGYFKNHTVFDEKSKKTLIYFTCSNHCFVNGKVINQDNYYIFPINMEDIVISISESYNWEDAGQTIDKSIKEEYFKFSKFLILEALVKEALINRMVNHSVVNIYFEAEELLNLSEELKVDFNFDVYERLRKMVENDLFDKRPRYPNQFSSVNDINGDKEKNYQLLLYGISQLLSACNSFYKNDKTKQPNYHNILDSVIGFFEDDPQTNNYPHLKETTLKRYFTNSKNQYKSLLENLERKDFLES